MKKNELSVYDITLLVTNKSDIISLKGNDRIFMYRLPYNNLNKDEKLEYEQYFQLVRDLYKTRQDFTDEFYSYLWTTQTLADIYLYGYENERPLKTSKTINSFAIAFLKEYNFKGINIDRMYEVSQRVITYWQSNTQLPTDDRIKHRQKFADILRAINECKDIDIQDIINTVKTRDFKKSQ